MQNKNPRPQSSLLSLIKIDSTYMLFTTYKIRAMDHNLLKTKIEIGKDDGRIKFF